MPWWGWVTIGSALYGWAWRLVFRMQCAEDRAAYGKVDGEFVALNAVLATIVACFAPFVFAAAAFRTATRSSDWDMFARKLGGESRKEKVARKECELRDREERIAQMEKELGIT